MDMRKYLELFISEAREHLEEAAEAVGRLEDSPADTELLNLLFRHGHSIKGMAASMGFAPIAAVSHALEDRYDEIRKGNARFGPGLAERSLQALEAISEAIDRIERGEEPQAGLTELASRLRQEDPDESPGGGSGPDPVPGGGALPPAPGAAAGAREGWIYNAEIVIEAGAAMPAARAVVLYKRLEGLGKILFAKPERDALADGPFDGRLLVQFSSTSTEARLRAELESLSEVYSVVLTPFMSVEESGAPASPAPAPSPSPTPPARPAAPTVRIQTDTLDRFLDHLGELIIHGGRLENALPAPDGAAAEALGSLRKTLDRLRADLMGLRMVPFEHIASRFVRSVRNLGGNLGKRVTLAIHGREVKLDRSMLEELVDPINHMLRNAVDHGIETPDERVALGKEPIGRISIRNREQGDAVSIEIDDDGRGMDPARIRAAAIQRGFVSPEDAAGMSEAEILMLVTTPGFSTAERLTEISGRGVGMDVVRTRIESLGGRMRIVSRPGGGTSIRLQLPLTVAVIHAFLVRCGEAVYAVPVGSVRRTFEASAGDVRRLGQASVIGLEEETVELLELARVMGQGNGGPAGGPALLYYHEDRPMGLVVDAILGKRDVVVKPLRSPLEHLREFSGATILEDGRIAMILDLLNLRA